MPITTYTVYPVHVMQKSITAIYLSQNVLNPAADHEKSSVAYCFLSK